MKIFRVVKTVFVGTLLIGAAAEAGLAMGNTYQNSDGVSLVTSFSGSDALQFVELGPVSCQATNKKIIAINSGSSSPEESCRRDFRIYGARMGAAIVLIEETRRIACEEPKPDVDCVFMRGRAYARRPQSASDTSTTYVPVPRPAARVADSNPRPTQHARLSFEVNIAPPLNAEQLRHYTDVGTVECDQHYYTGLSQTHEEQCRYNLQSAAFKKGADVVVIESKEVIPCKNQPGLNSKVDQGPCLKMTARGYRKAD